MVAWKMPTFFNVWRLTVYSKKMLVVTTKSKKKCDHCDTKFVVLVGFAFSLRVCVRAPLANTLTHNPLIQQYAAALVPRCVQHLGTVVLPPRPCMAALGLP